MLFILEDIPDAPQDIQTQLEVLIIWELFLALQGFCIIFRYILNKRSLKARRGGQQSWTRENGRKLHQGSWT